MEDAIAEFDIKGGPFSHDYGLPSRNTEVTAAFVSNEPEHARTWGKHWLLETNLDEVVLLVSGFLERLDTGLQ